MGGNEREREKEGGERESDREGGGGEKDENQIECLNYSIKTRGIP